MDLIAMIAAYGEPNVFETLTFSEITMPNRDDLLDPNYFISQLPYSIINAIQSRLRMICKFIMGINAKDDDFPLFGLTPHYFIRYEFQQRGQLHVHILL